MKIHLLLSAGIQIQPSVFESNALGIELKGNFLLAKVVGTLCLIPPHTQPSHHFRSYNTSIQRIQGAVPLGRYPRDT